MELRQLLYFKKVAELEHMSDAAVDLHVAQSAVSRQISNLEEELGVKLFVRSGRKIHLTPVGKIFLERVNQSLLELDKGKREIEDYLNPETGVIRVGMPSSLSARSLSKAIAGFKKEYPHIGFQLYAGETKELERHVIEGQIDLSFISPVPTDHSQLNGNIFFTEQVIALLPKDHELANEADIRLNQLQSDSFILLPEGNELRDIAIRACQEVGFDPIVGFESEDIEMIQSLVSAGLGISMLPEISLSNRLRKETTALKIIDPNVLRTVGLITPLLRSIGPTEHVFYDYITNYYEQLDQFGW
uniref:LysR family transcriptional regulator n=1 Tax=uncultured Allobacillus sp. TaxID=1638025 RepID=UPI00259A8C26|nr:LysR family transcriptional regulator [uncultured Allobacillus sp.]